MRGMVYVRTRGEVRGRGKLYTSARRTVGVCVGDGRSTRIGRCASARGTIYMHARRVFFSRARKECPFLGGICVRLMENRFVLGEAVASTIIVAEALVIVLFNMN